MLSTLMNKPFNLMKNSTCKVKLSGYGNAKNLNNNSTIQTATSFWIFVSLTFFWNLFP